MESSAAHCWQKCIFGCAEDKCPDALSPPIGTHGRETTQERAAWLCHTAATNLCSYSVQILHKNFQPLTGVMAAIKHINALSDYLVS